MYVLIVEFACFADSLILVIFYNIFMDRRYQSKGALVSLFGIVFAYLHLANFFTERYYISSAIVIVFDFIITLIFYKGKLLRKVFVVVALTLISSAGDLLTVGLNMVMGLDFVTIISDPTYSGISLLTAKLIIFMFVKCIEKVKQKSVVELAKPHWGLLVFITASGLVCLWGMLYFIYSDDENTGNLVALFLSVYVFANAMVVLFFFDKFADYYGYKYNFDMLKKQVQMEEAHYAEVYELHEHINTMRHDMKNHIVCIKSLLERQETDDAADYIDRIMKSIEENKMITGSNNTHVDSILNYKYREAELADIKIELNLRVTEAIRVDPVDICMVIANGMDNAIEACTAVGDKDDREIEMRLMVDKDLIVMEIQNTFLHKPVVKGQFFRTSKMDPEQHGFGMINMKKISEKYGGEFIVEQGENRFKILVTLLNEPV